MKLLKTVKSCAFFLIISFFLLGVNPHFVNADEGSEFAYGTVLAISDAQITVQEYDYEKDQEIQNNYMMTKETEIDGVPSLALVSVGDEVDIVYAVIDVQRVAQSLSFDKPQDGGEFDEREDTQETHESGSLTESRESNAP